MTVSALTALLLDGVTATGPGPWVMVHSAYDLAITIEGIVAGDEVDIEVSNHPGIRESIPASSVLTLGSTQTADGTLEPAEGYRWMRANLSANAGGGSVTARLTGTEAT